jgi:hypothetical protein
VMVHLGWRQWWVSSAAFFFDSPARVPFLWVVVPSWHLQLASGRASSHVQRWSWSRGVLGGQTWPLLFGLIVHVFRSSSRVSNFGRRYGALRSRAREQGLPSASETDHGLWPFDVRAGLFSPRRRAPSECQLSPLQV